MSAALSLTTPSFTGLLTVTDDKIRSTLYVPVQTQSAFADQATDVFATKITASVTDLGQHRIAVAKRQLGASLYAITEAGAAHRQRQLVDAFAGAAEVAQEEGMPPPNGATAQFALSALSRCLAFSDIEMPLLLPLPAGGISAEWHEHGLNIELRFRRVGDIYVVLEDALGQVPEFQGRDPGLFHAWRSMSALIHRSGS